MPAMYLIASMGVHKCIIGILTVAQRVILEVVPGVISITSRHESRGVVVIISSVTG